MAVFCDRCSRSFRTYNSKVQHVRDSPRHWQCPAECGEDCYSLTELHQHYRDTSCATLCTGCNEGAGTWWVDEEEYREHLEDYNVCMVCGRHFDSDDNLYQHELSHRALDYACLKCDRGFKTYGGMIIHLESGCCSDTDREQLDSLAAECHRWDEFIIFDDYVQNLIDGDLEYEHGKVCPYFCPTCEAAMPKLSSLFQHVESRSCSQTLDDGAISTLRHYLEACL